MEQTFRDIFSSSELSIHVSDFHRISKVFMFELDMKLISLMKTLREDDVKLKWKMGS